MTNHLLQNGQFVNVGAAQWNGDTLTFNGTSGAAGQTPTVTFSGLNALSGIAVAGSAAIQGYGAINIAPGGGLTIGSLSALQARLSIAERPGTSVTFNGTSDIDNGSTLTMTGYGGAGSYTLDGTMHIGAASTVNLCYVAVSGTGTTFLSHADSLLRESSVSAGETVKLDGGMLSLSDGMHFLGTITDSAPATSRIASGASVAVYNAFDAVRETFNRTTGVMDLFNGQGADVAHLRFAGHGDVYAAPTAGLATNYMAVSTHLSAGMLPVTFTN